MLGISHDYAHCEGKDCKLRDTCVRYLLHDEAVKENMTCITYLKPHYKGDRCMDYFKDWRTKK